MIKEYPENITFQWHVTELCNNRCKHCYQSGFIEEGLPYADLLKGLNSIKRFVKAASEFHGKAIQASIKITGGEPFLRKDVLPLLNSIAECGMFTFSVLSNGLLLSNEELRVLKGLEPRYIQVSLDGDELLNDKIRGRGRFQIITKALGVYQTLEIPSVVSFTANSLNYKSFGKVVGVAKKFGAQRVWADRYIPINKSDELIMSTAEVRDFIQILKQEQEKQVLNCLSTLDVAAHRALQFIECNGEPYHCKAGSELIAIMANGDLVPCRRLPIVIGNLLSDDLSDLYFNNELLQRLRGDKDVDSQCEGCAHLTVCKGGLKCLSYSLCGDPFKKDPNCWL